MNNLEYRKLKTLARKNYETNLAAIERVKLLSENPNNSHDISILTSGDEGSTESDKKSKKEIVEEELKNMNATFKTKNLLNHLRKKYPDVEIAMSYISNLLAKFVKEKILEIAKKGDNRRQGYTYKKKDHS